MFDCKVCGKQYRSQNSLTRHARNHGRHTAQPRCPVCNVVFARKDILNRHLQRSHPPTSTGVAGRARCHTACDACRRNRTRCDGQEPCSLCTARGTECVYAAASLRVSRAVPVIRDGEGDDLENEVGLGTLLDDHTDTVEAELNPSLPDSHNIAVDMPHQALPGHVSWPWLHETYYLQTEDIDWGTIEDHAAILSAPTHDAHPAGYHAFYNTSWPRSPQSSQLNSFGAQHTAARDVASELNCASRIQSCTESLVSIATSAAFSPTRTSNSQVGWHDVTQEIARLLPPEHPSPASISGEDDWILHHFLWLYMNNFNPLWPMVSTWQLDIDRFNPILLLTMASIGAMYGTDNSCVFGSSMHQRLRRLLAAAVFDLEGLDDDLVWLAQARLLAQVHALYFGQRQAFSYAQHLGSILVAQARRMNLFQELKQTMKRWACNDTTTPQDRCAQWTSQEARRRLAYGIMRADVYTGVLLDTRPFLSPAEVRLTLPRSNSIWHNTQQFSVTELCIAQQMEDDRIGGVLTCDAITIAMDPAEQLPDLDAVGYEVLIFGFQDYVWRFAHDPELLRRLTGNEKARYTSSCFRPPTSNTNTTQHWAVGLGLEGSAAGLVGLNDGQDLAQGSVDHVGQLHRQMGKLTSAYDQLCNALTEWERRVTTSRLSPHFAQNRDTLMSSLLLYHLSLLRLNTPLQDLHHVAYGASGVHGLDMAIVSTLRNWCDSDKATVATRHAINIWTLIKTEQQRAAEDRAKINLLGFLSLHPSAVVLWAAAQTQNLDQHRESLSAAGSFHPDAREILEDFARLFDGLSPLGGSSFKQAALRLSGEAFPRAREHS